MCVPSCAMRPGCAMASSARRKTFCESCTGSAKPRATADVLIDLVLAAYEREEFDPGRFRFLAGDSSLALDPLSHRKNEMLDNGSAVGGALTRSFKNGGEARSRLGATEQ